MVSNRPGGDIQKRLLAIAVASLGLYLLLALLYPLAPSLRDPRATWVSLIGGRWYSVVVHVALYLGLTLLYIVALWLLRASGGRLPAKQGRVNGLILITWLACSLVLMTVAPAGESHDIFDYVFRGRMMVQYQANPLDEIPSAYSKAPFYRFLAWHRSVDTYGPLWEMASAGVSAGVHQVAPLLNLQEGARQACLGSFSACGLLIAYLEGYRLFAIGLVGLSAGLIASMLRRIQPDLVPSGLAAWLWNPLALIAAAVGAHNDLLMVTLLLGGLWLMQRRRPVLALMALILALHVKLTVLIWLPVFGLWVIRQWGWRRALGKFTGALLLGLLTSWLLYLPFGGWGTLPRMLHERSLYAGNSVWQVVHEILYRRYGWPQDTVIRLTSDLPTGLFVVGAILLSLWLLNFLPKRWKSPIASLEGNDRLLWSVVTAISLLYLVIGAFWFQHWYILWVLAPAALLPGSAFTRLILPWLSFGVLLANLGQSVLLDYLPGIPSRPLVYLLILAMIWVPGLIAAGKIAMDNRKELL
jgi:hypothetical protein